MLSLQIDGFSCCKEKETILLKSLFNIYIKNRVFQYNDNIYLTEIIFHIYFQSTL